MWDNSGDRILKIPETICRWRSAEDMRPYDEPVKQNDFCTWNHTVTKSVVKNKIAVSFTFDAYDRRFVAEIKVEQCWR